MVEDPAGYGTDEHKPKSKRPFLIASGFPMRQFWLVFQGKFLTLLELCLFLPFSQLFDRVL